MQQSSHIGKIVVTPPRLENIVVPQRGSFQVSTDKIHLITGGAGGFGLETALWLADKGAKHLVLVGRSGAKSHAAQDALAVLAAKGVRRSRRSSGHRRQSCGPASVLPASARILPALGGVIHAAMVLDDAMISNLTAEAFEQVLRPKVTGADMLDQLTQFMSLDYFVLFSSATTLVGNPGQAAYVAANGYLEGLARRRRAAGRPALAICWGAIEDVGVLARSETTREALAHRIGIKGMPAREALRHMEEALSAPASADGAVVAIAPIGLVGRRGSTSRRLRAPSYKKLTSPARPKPASKARSIFLFSSRKLRR